jgi:hypothetical protein
VRLKSLREATLKRPLISMPWTPRLKPRGTSYGLFMQRNGWPSVPSCVSFRRWPRSFVFKDLHEVFRGTTTLEAPVYSFVTA